jgi:DNA-directed RNA polymerase subunit M/transcription elongation factor TFIIS
VVTPAQTEDDTERQGGGGGGGGRKEERRKRADIFGSVSNSAFNEVAKKISSVKQIIFMPPVYSCKSDLRVEITRPRQIEQEKMSSEMFVKKSQQKLFFYVMQMQTADNNMKSFFRIY